MPGGNVNNSHVGEIGGAMDDRLRDVEGDVHTLKDWRARTVDPWIESGADFRKHVGAFITRLEAQEELRQQLNDERHESNTLKLNSILVIAAIMTCVFTALLVVATWQLAKQHGQLVPMQMFGSNHMTETAQEAVIPLMR
jgi:hypothetical protein